jgi:hypothetical protein
MAIKYDFDNIDDFFNEVIKNGLVIIGEDTRTYYINLVGLLDEDKTINLELLEVIVQCICNAGVSKINLINPEEYFEIRDIIDNVPQQKEELNFISKMISTLCTEFSDEQQPDVYLLTTMDTQLDV